MQKQFLARWRSSNMSASQVTTRLLKVTSKELRHVAVERRLVPVRQQRRDLHEDLRSTQSAPNRRLAPSNFLGAP